MGSGKLRTPTSAHLLEQARLALRSTTHAFGLQHPGGGGPTWCSAFRVARRCRSFGRHQQREGRGLTRWPSSGSAAINPRCLVLRLRSGMLMVAGTATGENHSLPLISKLGTPTHGHHAYGTGQCGSERDRRDCETAQSSTFPRRASWTSKEPSWVERFHFFLVQNAIPCTVRRP